MLQPNRLCGLACSNVSDISQENSQASCAVAALRALSVIAMKFFTDLLNRLVSDRSTPRDELTFSHNRMCIAVASHRCSLCETARRNLQTCPRARCSTPSDVRFDDNVRREDMPVKNRYLKASVLSMAVICCIHGAANAQESEPAAPVPADAANTAEPQIGEVVVSGSRISNTEYGAPTPVAVVGAETLERDAKVSIGDSIRELPA